MGHVKDRWFTTRDGDKVPTARNGKGLRWQVWLTVEGRETYGGSYRTKAMAERQLLEMESRAARGQWVDPGDQTTVTEVVRDYLATRRHRRRSAERMDSLVRIHVEPTPLGSRRAQAVRPSEVQGWVSDRAEHLAPSTLALLVGMVRSAFDAAVHDRVLASSPCTRLTLPSIGSGKVVPLTVAQVQLLAEAIGTRPPAERGADRGGAARSAYRAMVIAQAGLGLRIGELLALRTDDVDFLARSVDVNAQIDRQTRARVRLKTDWSARQLPLPDAVGLALSRHLQAVPPSRDGLIFHNTEGRPFWYSRYNLLLGRAAARAGLPSTSTHDLRHHFASVLLAAGLSVVAVAELLGHRDAQLVITTYGHLLPGSEQVARRAVDTAWSEPDPGAETATAR